MKKYYAKIGERIAYYIETENGLKDSNVRGAVGDYLHILPEMKLKELPEFIFSGHIDGIFFCDNKWVLEANNE